MTYIVDSVRPGPSEHYVVARGRIEARASQGGLPIGIRAAFHGAFPIDASPDAPTP